MSTQLSQVHDSHQFSEQKSKIRLLRFELTVLSSKKPDNQFVYFVIVLCIIECVSMPEICMPKILEMFKILFIFASFHLIIFAIYSEKECIHISYAMHVCIFYKTVVDY